MGIREEQNILKEDIEMASRYFKMFYSKSHLSRMPVLKTGRGWGRREMGSLVAGRLHW